MANLYNIHPETKEYLPGRDSEARENPKFSTGTHSEDDRYLYNRITSTLIPPPETGDNETARFVGGQWEVVQDFRGNEYWDKVTREKHIITDLGEEPDPGWVDSEPLPYQTWDEGGGWTDDLGLWLDVVVRPERDWKMAAFDWRIQRYAREMRLGLTPTDDVSDLDTYMQALADLPAALNSITDPVPWPVEP